MSKKKLFLLNHNYYYHFWFCYHSLFFGSLIFHGKKLRAFQFFLKLKYNLKLRELNDPYLIFLVAMMNVTPKVLIQYLWLGGAKKGIGLPIKENKQIQFAVRWTLTFLKKKDRNLKLSSLADLLIHSLYNKGEGVRKKQSVHSLAIENRYLMRFLK